MKLLLTSAGVRNASIHKALVGLLRKPIVDCVALCIPTAMYGHPAVGPGAGAWRFISGQEPECPMSELGSHLDHPMLPENTMADAERWAAGIPGPSYAIDDDTAIKVSGGAVEVVSEGHWRRFPS